MKLDPHTEGVNAYNNGEDESMNPYVDSDDAASQLQWSDGWQLARQDDLNEVFKGIKTK